MPALLLHENYFLSENECILSVFIIYSRCRGLALYFIFQSIQHTAALPLFLFGTKQSLVLVGISLLLLDPEFLSSIMRVRQSCLVQPSKSPGGDKMKDFLLPVLCVLTV